MKTLMIVLVVLAMGTAAFGLYKTLTAPSDLYAFTGEFAGCPPRPSCVSSVASDDAHRVPALSHTGDNLRAVSMLREVIDRMGGEIAHEDPGYLHAVFTTPRMRYRDDVELLVLPEGRIEVRSISRFGYRDFGVNRKRLEQLRQAFEVVP